jgi:hypothetical protein
MDEAYEKGEQERLDASEIAAMATEIARGAIEHYRAGNEYQVEETRKEDGTTEFTVTTNLGHGDSIIAQRMCFSNNGVLARMYSHYGESFYLYDEREGFLNFAIYRRKGSREKTREITVLIAKDRQTFMEEEDFGGQQLTVSYVPKRQGNFIFFSQDKAFLGWSGEDELPVQDVERILPLGRQISLDDLLGLGLDLTLFRQRDGYGNPNIPTIPQTDGFPLLVHYRRGHEIESIWMPDFSCGINGIALPLEADPCGWLTFVKFSNKPYIQARAFVMSIRQEGLSVKDIEGVPTIECTVLVDDQEIPVTLPVKTGRFVPHKPTVLRRLKIKVADFVANKIVARSRTDIRGKWVQTTLEEVESEVKNGFLNGSILRQAVYGYYLAHYAPKPE